MLSICEKCGDSFDTEELPINDPVLCVDCYWSNDMESELDREDAAELERVIEEDREADYAFAQWQQIEQEW